MYPSLFLFFSLTLYLAITTYKYLYNFHRILFELILYRIPPYTNMLYTLYTNLDSITGFQHQKRGLADQAM
ncbi:hypothetical protein Hanom_Chr10g00943531 [Helianthus anomalus]